MKRVAACALVILAISAFASAQTNFRIAHPMITEGSARSSSANFFLQGCLSIGIGGTSSSNSFQMQSGCAILFLDKDNASQKPKPGEAGRIGSNTPNGKAGQTNPPASPDSKP